MEHPLMEKIRRASLGGLRKPVVLGDVFRRVAYIPPAGLSVENAKLRPVAVFNPGIAVRDGMASLFVRVVAGYFRYSSAIAAARVSLESLLDYKGGVIQARIVIHPSEVWDISGCEDPRVYQDGDNYIVLYTGLGFYQGRAHGKSSQGYVVLDEGFAPASPKRRFRLLDRHGREIEVVWWRNSAILRREGKEAVVLTRPTVDSVEVAWRGLLKLEDGSVEADHMEPILGFEDWEVKVGWSTNPVQISSNEYLVGWHGVLKDSYIYMNGLAVVSSSGELLGVTDYLLAPKTIDEFFGDSPGVIYGCGLALWKDKVLWFGGVADSMIGIYEADLDEVLGRMRWVR